MKSSQKENEETKKKKYKFPLAPLFDLLLFMGASSSVSFSSKKTFGEFHPSHPF
jgi:hypothetical protein